MIDRNVNVIKDNKIKRIVEYSADNKQINIYLVLKINNRD